MEPTTDWNPDRYDGGHAFVWEAGTSLVRLLGAKPGERVVDLGCGTGHLAAEIAATGVEVIGIDAAPAMIERARALHPGVRFEVADVRDLDLGEPFDAAFSNATLHWVVEADRAARSIRQALKRGGRFVAELGGRGNVATIVQALGHAARSAGLGAFLPAWYFPSLAEYAALLERHGFEVSSAALFDRPTPLQGEGGMRDWVAMFAGGLLDRVSAEDRDAFLTGVESATHPVLFRDGVWVADYRRLRIVARAV